MSRPKDSRFPYMPGIDAMRALAVLAVFGYHAGLDWVPGGFLGVDVFFVISGYLITSLLLREFRGTGHIELGPLLAAPRPPPPPRRRRADRGGDDRLGDRRAGQDRPDPRRRARLALLLRQLALHLRPHVLLRTVRPALALHPPLVALGGGAVLPLLAAGLRRRDEALRPRPTAARGARRGDRLGRPRLDPLRPRPRRLADLLRHRHPRGRPARRRRPGPGLEPDRAAPPHKSSARWSGRSSTRSG